MPCITIHMSSISCDSMFHLIKLDTTPYHASQRITMRNRAKTNCSTPCNTLPPHTNFACHSMLSLSLSLPPSMPHLLHLYPSITPFSLFYPFFDAPFFKFFKVFFSLLFRQEASLSNTSSIESPPTCVSLP